MGSCFASETLSETAETSLDDSDRHRQALSDTLSLGARARERGRGQGLHVIARFEDEKHFRGFPSHCNLEDVEFVISQRGCLHFLENFEKILFECLVWRKRSSLAHSLGRSFPLVCSLVRSVTAAGEAVLDELEHGSTALHR